MFDEGVKVSVNQQGANMPRLETVLRGYSETVSRGEKGAYFQGGECAVIQEVVTWDDGKPELVNVEFEDGREDCVFVDWLDVVS